MLARHLALGIGAALLLGLGVYLFLEVRAQTAAPEPAPRVTERERTPPPPADPEPEARARAVAPAQRATAAAAPPTSPPGPSATRTPVPDQEPLFGGKLDAAMDEANKAYDRGDFDEARTIASRVLVAQPGNVRMLRVVVSSACIDGDAATAQTHFARLPPADQAQMRTRCARYSVSFPEDP